MADYIDFSFLAALDKKLSSTINQQLAQPWLDPVMELISSHSLWLTLVAIWLVYSLANKRKDLLWFLLVAFFIVGLADLFAFEVLKPAFGRLRPCKTDALVRIVNSCGGKLSFPSNHATNTMTMAVLLVLLKGGWLGGVALISAVVVGLSRVYLGVHYFGDIMAGFLVGGCWAWVSAQLLLKAKFLAGLRKKLAVSAD